MPGMHMTTDGKCSLTQNTPGVPIIARDHMQATHASYGSLTKLSPLVWFWQHHAGGRWHACLNLKMKCLGQRGV
jgi:hypothetical protein